MQTVQQGQQARLVLTQKSAERWLAAADTVWLDDLIPSLLLACTIEISACGKSTSVLSL